MICGLYTYMYEVLIEAITLRETVNVRIFILYRNHQVDRILLCSEIVSNSKDQFHFFTACLHQYQLHRDTREVPQYEFMLGLANDTCIRNTYVYTYVHAYTNDHCDQKGKH